MSRVAYRIQQFYGERACLFIETDYQMRRERIALHIFVLSPVLKQRSVQKYLKCPTDPKEIRFIMPSISACDRILSYFY